MKESEESQLERQENKLTRTEIRNNRNQQEEEFDMRHSERRRHWRVLKEMSLKDSNMLQVTRDNLRKKKNGNAQ